MSAEDRAISVLVLEDNPEDAELLLRRMRRAGFNFSARHVETESEFTAALSDLPDVILSDYRMPDFTGLRALQLMQERGLDIPFLIISGTIGEETAVEVMRQGATDYLLKDRLGRLPSALRRALDESQAKRARRESDERFRQVVESIHEVFWMSTADKTRMIYVSPGYERIWMRPCAELYAAPQSWAASIHPEDRERVWKAAANQTEGRYDETYRILRPDGSVRWIRDRGFPVREPSGEVRRIAGVAEDVTERKELERQFLHAQRLEAIGTLAGGVAHDLNNILAPVLMVAGILKKRLTSDSDRDMVTMIEQSGQRGAAVIRQLLSFCRGAAVERVIVQPRHLIRDMAQIMRETFPRNIAIEDGFERDLLTIEADPSQLHQVLMNLCVNARDAMPAGGRLILAAANTEVSLEEAREAGVRPGPYVRIRVSDTGSGIPPGLLGRIFEPFFTTKEAGKGTGLGLSTVKSIVQSHGGFVRLRSEVGSGSEFEVFFPAREEGASAPPPAERAAPSEGQGEMVLFVDDESVILAAARQILERSRYRVLTAASGEEALRELMQNGCDVRLIVTDLMMPGMGGPALVRAVRLLDRALPILAISGLGSEIDHAELSDLGVAGVLERPFDAAPLLAAVQKALAPPKRAG